MASPALQLFIRPALSMTRNFLVAICLSLSAENFAAAAGWPHYGGDAGGQRYSPLSQINRWNVSRLQVAWTLGGQATPMTYSLDSRQYVVVAAGGYGKAGTDLGDFLIAFALPGE